MKLNKHSKTITQDDSLPAAQAMLYGIGLKDEDFKKPQLVLLVQDLRVIHVIYI